MDWYFWALVVGAAATGLKARNIPRAQLWISLLAASFALSSLWHAAGWPHGPLFGVATNVIIAGLLYAKAEHAWEFRVWNCLHLMITIEVLYIAGAIHSHFDYAVALELANWLALVFIFFSRQPERVESGNTALGPDRRGSPSLLHRALYAKRTHPPFWEVW